MISVFYYLKVILRNGRGKWELINQYLKGNRIYHIMTNDQIPMTKQIPEPCIYQYIPKYSKKTLKIKSQTHTLHPLLKQPISTQHSTIPIFHYSTRHSTRQLFQLSTHLTPSTHPFKNSYINTNIHLNNLISISKFGFLSVRHVFD